MSEIEWINVVRQSLGYYVELLEQIKLLKEAIQKIQNKQKEVTRLKTLVKELQEQHGYDTVH